MKNSYTGFSIPTRQIDIQQKNQVDQLSVAAGNKDKRLRFSNIGNQTVETGKHYPGRINFETMRVQGRASTVVRSIVLLRNQQVAKTGYKIIPKDKEPSRQVSVLKYSAHSIISHPAFDDAEKTFLLDVYDRLDPGDVTADKRKKFKETKHDEFTDFELDMIDSLEEKHRKFYTKRLNDINTIKKLLDKPDANHTYTMSWGALLSKVIEDILLLDRGVIFKHRDASGNVIGLIPLDATGVKPVINEFGFVSKDQAFVQFVDGAVKRFMSMDDVIIISMNPTTEASYFGYGVSPMETLYTAVLTDLFIDKGNIDYYRKGGSVPEIMINLKPSVTKDGVLQQFSPEQIDAVQRKMQAILEGDWTQVPVFGGAEISVIDMKGKRKDMQFRELAEANVRKICAVFQCSPQDVGFLQDVNRSTGETQAEMTKSKGLETLMAVISQAFTSQVINEIRKEGDLALGFDDLDLERQKSLWSIQYQQLQTGYRSVNEIRSEEGFSPVPWGDTPLQGNRNWQDPTSEAAKNKPNPLAMLGLGGQPGLPSMGGANPEAGRPPMGQEQMPGIMNKSFVRKSVFDDLIDNPVYKDLDISSLVDFYMKDVDMSKVDNILGEIEVYLKLPNVVENYALIAKSLNFDVKDESNILKNQGIVFVDQLDNTLTITDTGEYALNILLSTELCHRLGEPDNNLVQKAVARFTGTEEEFDLVFDNIYSYNDTEIDSTVKKIQDLIHNG